MSMPLPTSARHVRDPLKYRAQGRPEEKGSATIGRCACGCAIGISEGRIRAAEATGSSASQAKPSQDSLPNHIFLTEFRTWGALMAELTFGRRCRWLGRAMREDPCLVWGRSNLAHRLVAYSYAGLVDEFGPRRGVNTPISNNHHGSSVVGSGEPVSCQSCVTLISCVPWMNGQPGLQILYSFGGQRVFRGGSPGDWHAAASRQHCSERGVVSCTFRSVGRRQQTRDGKGFKKRYPLRRSMVFLEHRELFLSKGEVPMAVQRSPG